MALYFDQPPQKLPKSDANTMTDMTKKNMAKGLIHFH